MSNSDFKSLTPAEIEPLPLAQLRAHLALAWKIKPHNRISRNLLVKSLIYKVREANGLGLGFEQQQKLDQLVRAYKRSSDMGSKRHAEILPGTRFIRDWKGQQHIVTVLGNGFEYQGKTFRSISAIAFAITGVRWNGWTFFGIKKPTREEAA